MNREVHGFCESLWVKLPLATRLRGRKLGPPPTRLLLKFAYQDFLEDRQFKNTTEANINNYKMLLGEFIDYSIKQEVVNDITPI